MMFFARTIYMQKKMHLFMIQPLQLVAPRIRLVVQTQSQGKHTMTNSINSGNQVIVGEWALINVMGGQVCIGDKMQDFRGDDVVITGMGNPPHKQGSTGRVELDGREYFPSVAGCEWVNFADKGLTLDTSSIKFCTTFPR